MWLGSIAAALAADDEIVRLVRLLDDQYLERAHLDPAEMLRGAAANVADDTPWLICRDVPDGVRLSHGDGRVLGTATARTLGELPAAVDRLRALLAAETATGVDDLLRDGLTRPLDPYTLVLSGEPLERFDSRVRGSATEVGLRLVASSGTLVVTDVLPGSPAERGGLRPGDGIHMIGGHPTFHMKPEEADRRLRGAEGTHVNVIVRRGGRDRTVALRREVVVQPDVRWDVPGEGVGRLRIASISQLTVSHVRAALLDLAERGALERGLVLDLRGNSGGSLRDSALVVDLFVRDGTLLRTMGRNGPGPAQLPDRIVALDDGQEPDVPIAVLVDETTASGAEIVAGGLVALDRAVLVGATTWGKGTVQRTWPLVNDDVRVKMTVARFLLPGDREVPPGGFVPDQVVARLDADAMRLGGWSADAPWRASEGELWQVDEPGEARDLPLELAVRTLLATTSMRRADLLDALRRSAVEARGEELFRLAGALLGRADWRPGPLGEEPPSATVQLRTRPLPPDRLEVTATVDNADALELGRVLVALHGGPLDGVLVPVGWVPPGARLTGSTVVRLEPDQGGRTVSLSGTMLADGRPPLAVEARPADLPAPPASDLRVQARLVPVDGERHRIEIALANAGRNQRDLDVHLAFPEDLGIRLLTPGSGIIDLPSGAAARVEMQVQVAVDAPDPLSVTLVAESRELGTVLEVPVHLPRNGTTALAVRPDLQHDAPVHAATGTLPLTVWSRDDHGVADLTVSLYGERLAWAGGGGPAVSVTAQVPIHAGANVVDLWTRDVAGAERAQRVWIWGEDGAAAVASPR